MARVQVIKFITSDGVVQIPGREILVDKVSGTQ